MKLKDLRTQRDEILKLAEKHGVDNVRVFGSVARDEATPTSDVDLLIHIADRSKFTWAGGGLVADLEDLLGCEIDIATEKELHWYIRERVIAEAVPL